MMTEELPTYLDINPFGHRDLDGHDAARTFRGVDKQAAYKMFDDNLFFYSEDLGGMGEEAFRYYSGALYDYTTYLSQSSSCEADEFLSHSEDILSIFSLRKIYYKNSNYANDPYKSICNICIKKLKTIQTSTLSLYSEEGINKMILEFKSIMTHHHICKLRDSEGHGTLFVWTAILLIAISLLCISLNVLLNTKNEDIAFVHIPIAIASIVFIIFVGIRGSYALFAKTNYIFEDKQITIHYSIFDRKCGRISSIQITEPCYYFAQCKRSGQGVINLCSHQYDNLVSVHSLSYSVMLINQNEKTTLFVSCYKCKAEEFIAQFKQCYPSIKGITSEGYLLEPDKQLAFYNANSLEATSAKEWRPVAGGFALAFLFIIALLGLGINLEIDALESPPKESGWIQTEGELRKKHSTSSDASYDYSLVYYWGGKRYRSHTTTSYSDIERAINGKYQLYVNPNKPSNNCLHLDSREDIKKRIHLLTVLAMISILLCIAFTIVMIRCWKKSNRNQIVNR